ncbi:nuclear transport factor 2 family protein [Luteimonas saliphila]|uniref:nuclear transport factor 2 family protein n=1 Tax=Luteimonas saliphila TaxID=2804919 RepID=UPI00192E14EF|nr:nuclear transport factor 2 family protein [Luteimonas saliphila]
MQDHDPKHRRQAVATLLAVPVAFAAGALAAPAQARTPAPATLEARLAGLEAREQITEILYRYARGWDRLDEEALRSCFFDDAAHQHGGFKGLSQEFITVALPMVAKVRSTTHAISNVMIELAGDVAISECYFSAHHRRATADGSDEEDYFLDGRYIDRFEKRDGVWKIASRRGLNSMERVEPRADRTFASARPDSFGQRKPDDPLYTALESLRGTK